MVNIMRKTICSGDVNSRKDTQMYLWLQGKGKDEKEWKRIVSINVDDGINMTNDAKSYDLEGQDSHIIPKNVSDFDEYISEFMRAVYNSTKLVSPEEYYEFCLKRLAIYQKIYHSNSRICKQFFVRYFPKNKYKNVWEMFEVYKGVVEKEVNFTMVRRGGGFIGCYEDDWGRKRPLTEPIRYEKSFDYVEELKVCLREELKNESK